MKQEKKKKRQILYGMFERILAKNLSELKSSATFFRSL